MSEVVRLTPELDGLDRPEQRPSVIKRLRDHHHLVARLVAKGWRTTDIANEVGLSISRVSILKGDPAFQQLVETYRMNENAMRDALELDVIKKQVLLEGLALQQMVDKYLDTPDEITHEMARADYESVHDRMHGKLNRNINVSMTDQQLAERHEKRRLHLDLIAEKNTEEMKNGS